MAAPKQRRRREGYVAESPAICLVIHDPAGKPLPPVVQTQILNTVTQIALDNRLLINFTTT